MIKETSLSRVESNGLMNEVIGLGDLKVKFFRDLSGRITEVRPLIDGVEMTFVEVDGRLIFESKGGKVVIEQEPPLGLQRERSGHLPVPKDRQLWVVDFVHGDECLTTTLPVVETEGNSRIRFVAQENKETRQQPFLPFTLTVDHPDLFSPKTDVVSLLQIFGHAPAAVRMLQAMPESLRARIFLAAKNTDNVPKAMSNARNLITGLAEGFSIPLVYDDGASGGTKLLDRKAAIWWLSQNPELFDRVMRSRVIMSDFREEVALLKQIADSHDLPQIFFGLTYLWPQRLNEIQELHPVLRRVKDRLATKDEKVQRMVEVGLGQGDAVVDWFSWVREWKAGVRNSHAHAVDLVVNFGLVSPLTRPPDVENCVVLPPRTRVESSSVDSQWANNMRRVLVTIGSGDWTEKELFVPNLLQAAAFLPNCEFIVVGNNGNSPEKIEIPKNVRLLGTVEPQLVDGLIASCELAVIKPGHFSLEETAGKLTLVAGPDNVERAVEISKRDGTPRAVAIAVEVDEERLTNAIELWLAMGSPADFVPFIDISNPEKIANKVQEALEKSLVLSKKLPTISENGTVELVRLIDRVLNTTFDRADVRGVIQDIKDKAKTIWEGDS